MRESTSRVKIFKNFKERKSFKPEFGAEGIFGGHLLGVRASNSLSFYDWESLELVRRIEILVRHVSASLCTVDYCRLLEITGDYYCICVVVVITRVALCENGWRSRQTRLLALWTAGLRLRGHPAIQHL